MERRFLGGLDRRPGVDADEGEAVEAVPRDLTDVRQRVVPRHDQHQLILPRRTTRLAAMQHQMTWPKARENWLQRACAAPGLPQREVRYQPLCRRTRR